MAGLESEIRRAFGQVGEHVFRAPQCDVVPVRLVLPFASLRVLLPPACGDRERRNRRSVRRELGLRVLAQVSNQLNSVQTLACHIEAPLQGFTITE